MSHTPGPWVKDIAKWRDEDAESEMIMVFGKEGVGYGRIAHVYAECGGEVEANARLIAAAPELLEALESARNWIGPNSTQLTRLEIVSIMESAIAKALGDD